MNYVRLPHEECSRFCSGDLVEPWHSAWEDDAKPCPGNPVPMDPLAEPHLCTRLHRPRRSLDFYYSACEARHADPSPHHALVLQTAARPVPTLNETIDSLEAAGLSRWPGPKICSSDGPDESSVPFNKEPWHLFRSRRQVGAACAFVRSLRLALAVDPDLDLLTFVEDDVEVCKNALDYVARIAIPRDVAFVTWFTYDYDWSSPPHESDDLLNPSDLAKRSGRPVLGCRPARFFILTQACTFTRETVDRILACPRVARDWPKLDCHDEMIAWALGDATYAAHFPVLVQHTGGKNSAVSLARTSSGATASDVQEGARTSPYYVGRDFDALTLLEKK